MELAPVMEDVMELEVHPLVQVALLLIMPYNLLLLPLPFLPQRTKWTPGAEAVL
jgi:hypothetical protein